MNYEIKKQSIDSYNYFFTKLVIKIFQNLLSLSLSLIICSFLNNIIAYILVILLVLNTLYNIYKIYNKYEYILTDIKNTINEQNLSFEVNLNKISNGLLKDIFSYGK